MGALPTLENHPQGWQAAERSRPVHWARQHRPEEEEHFPDQGPLLRAEKNLARPPDRA